MSDHLGYEKRGPAGHGSGNSRNGTGAKTILTDDGEIDIAVSEKEILGLWIEQTERAKFWLKSSTT